jgi:hypothetical protein
VADDAGVAIDAWGASSAGDARRCRRRRGGRLGATARVCGRRGQRGSVGELGKRDDAYRQLPHYGFQALAGRRGREWSAEGARGREKPDQMTAGLGNPADTPVPVPGASSAQYHRGRKPTLSSPCSTSAVSVALSSRSRAPDPGLNDTRQTLGPDGAILCRRVAKHRAAQSRHNKGSHADGLSRTRRGIPAVLNDWTALTTPPGVRNPTTISYSHR